MSYARFLLSLLADSSCLKTSTLCMFSMSLRCGIAVNRKPGPKNDSSAETSAKNQDSMHCTIRCACSTRAPAGRCQPSRELKCCHGLLFGSTRSSPSTRRSGISSEFAWERAVRNFLKGIISASAGDDSGHVSRKPCFLEEFRKCSAASRIQIAGTTSLHIHPYAYHRFPPNSPLRHKSPKEYSFNHTRSRSWSNLLTEVELLSFSQTSTLSGIWDSASTRMSE